MGLFGLGSGKKSGMNKSYEDKVQEFNSRNKLSIQTKMGDQIYDAISLAVDANKFHRLSVQKDEDNRGIYSIFVGIPNEKSKTTWYGKESGYLVLHVNVNLKNMGSEVVVNFGDKDVKTYPLNEITDAKREISRFVSNFIRKPEFGSKE